MKNFELEILYDEETKVLTLKTEKNEVIVNNVLDESHLATAIELFLSDKI